MESNPKLLKEAINPNEFEELLEEKFDDSGFDYVNHSKDFVDLVNSVDVSSKKIALLALVKKLVSENHRKVIIWCIFVDSINSINNLLSDNNISVKSIYGVTPIVDRTRIINDFKNNGFDVLITNPHTLGESISLHQVCHDAIYFEFSYNLVHLLQSKDRIHRLGLPEDAITQWYFLENVYKWKYSQYSFDDKIYKRLKDKEKNMLDAIENNEFEDPSTSQEDIELIFKDIF
jgi:SNF2 family DNA or RNA helicase